MGAVTGGRLEIKTSGRYTYEMGVALSTRRIRRMRRCGATGTASRSTWRWPARSAAMPTEQKMARTFITTRWASARRTPAQDDLFDSPASCRAALEALPPSPEHMFFFEYNFLYVLAAGGRPDKAALGDHSPAGTHSARASTRSATRRGSTSRRRSPTTSSSWRRTPGSRAPTCARRPPHASSATRRSKRCSRTSSAHKSTMTRKPPYAIRFMSIGIDFGSIMLPAAGPASPSC